MPLPIEPEIGPSTLNIGLISGGRAPNVIADKAEAHLLVPSRRSPPTVSTRESILKTVGDRADVEFSSLDLPFVRICASSETFDPPWTPSSPPKSSSLTEWGEPFLLGPGSVHVAHTLRRKNRQEKNLLECVDLYYNLASDLVK